MIVGLVGGVPQDIYEVTSLLSKNRCIQVVDSIEILRMLDRHTINSLTVQSYHKQYFLKLLEDKFGTIIVTGNIILSEDIINWILDNYGVIVIVSRKDMNTYDVDTLKSLKKYWGESSVQKYHVETRWKNLYERLKDKRTYYIDVSDSESLSKLHEVAENWDDSSVCGVSSEDLVNITKIRKDGKSNMTMEESIKKAMRELGMDVDEDNSDETKKSTKGADKKIEPRKKTKNLKNESVITKDFINPPEVEQNTEFEDKETEEDTNTNDSIFVKISDGTMALLLPVGLQLEQQNIAGMNFKVATIEIPDINSTKLQELPIRTGIQGKSQSTSKKQWQQPKMVIKRQPIISDSDESSEIITISSDLKKLQEEKMRLDAEIKRCRAAGDTEQVDVLRKQRRVVRKKINSLK